MKNIILGIVLSSCIWILVLIFSDIPAVIVYDCRLAEISPDYPISVKQECRKMQYDHQKDEQYERKNENGIYGGRTIVL